MALPGTHCRFALALKKRYPIRDEKRFIAGTLYPDSRWLTGLPREKTHKDAYLTRASAGADFTAGWRVHLLCDRIQADCFKDAFPEIDGMDTESAWVTASALKVAQDMVDSQKTDMNRCLDCLTTAEAPNGEDIEGVRAYYRLVRKTYGAGVPPSHDAYRMQWANVGVPPETIAAIMLAVERWRVDDKCRRTLSGIFATMVDRCRGNRQRHRGVEKKVE